MKSEYLVKLLFSLRTIVINFFLLVCSLMVGLWGINAVLVLMKLPGEAYVPENCQNYQEQISFDYSQSLTNAFYPSNSELPVCTRDFFVVNHSDSLGYLGYGRSEIANRKQHLVFGDSFAYGYGVSQEKAFAATINAYNAGLWGNTYPQHLRVFRRIVGESRIQRAYWVVYPPHLISATNNGWMTSTNFSPVEYPWLCTVLDFFNKTQLSSVLLATTGIGFNRGDYYTPEWRLFNEQGNSFEEGYRAFQKTAENLAQLAKENRIELMVILMPSKQQMMLKVENKRPFFIGRNEPLDAELPMKRLSNILIDSGIPFNNQINLLPYFAKKNWQDLYFPHDAHLNENGNKYVAEILLRASQ